MGKHIVMIDDDEMVIDAVGDIMSAMGHEVTTFRDPLLGEGYALVNDFDLLLLDLHMPGRTGAEVAETVLSKRPEACVLLITGHAEDPLAQRALRAGVRAVVRKPFEVGVVLDYLNADVGHC